MSIPRPWRRPVLDAGLTRHADHTVFFYETDDQLLERLTAYAIDGAFRHQQTLVIAQHTHIKGLRMRLAGWELTHVLKAYDATWALSQFMTVDGPDRTRFRALLDRVVPEDATDLRLYGEMVALLWKHDRADAALALEELWNEYLEGSSLPLLCGYPSSDVSGHPLGDAVCQAHDHVFPSLVA